MPVKCGYKTRKKVRRYFRHRRASRNVIVAGMAFRIDIAIVVIGIVSVYNTNLNVVAACPICSGRKVAQDQRIESGVEPRIGEKSEHVVATPPELRYRFRLCYFLHRCSFQRFFLAEMIFHGGHHLG